MKNLFKLCITSIAIFFLIGTNAKAYKHELEKGLDFKDPEIVMKLAISTPPSLAGFRGIYDFEEEVEARSGGRIDVKIYHSGSMGGNNETVNKCQAGVIQATLEGAPVTSNLADPVHNILNIPFLFDSFADAKKFLNSELVNPVYGSLDSAGMKIIGICSFGKIDFLTRKKINSVSDLNGLKMRSNPGKWGVIPAKAIGIEASPIPFPEVYIQLQQGILDGIINSPDVITLGKWEEICKFYTKVGFYHGFIVFAVNQKWFDKLDENLKTIIIEAGSRMAKIEMERAEYRYLQILNKFKEKGFQINELDPNEIQKMKVMWSEHEKEFIYGIGREYYEKVINLLYK
jgi:TRAP-type C4-dicarboxylate transport system substrate-binding protein